MELSKVDRSDLFKRIADENDEKAFSVFFKQYHTKLLRYASLFVGSIDVSEDVVSEVLINLLKRDRSAFLKKNFIGYLFQCVKNKAIDHIRKEKKKRAIFSASYDEGDYFIRSSQTPLSVITHNELYQTIRDLIEALPPKRRMVFQLIKDEGLSYKDVADLMDISERTVEVHLKLALKDIQTTLQKDLDNPNNNLDSSSALRLVFLLFLT